MDHIVVDKQLLKKKVMSEPVLASEVDKSMANEDISSLDDLFDP